jgi:hypothetical protein
VFYLEEDSLDFALTHIMDRGDTDILPPAAEFEAVFDQWDELRSFLCGSDLDNWSVRPLRRCLSPKRHLGLRICTQLDPLDSLVVTALVYEIGANLEASRVPRSQGIVHSHRFDPDETTGRFYAPDPNFSTFRASSLDRARTRGGFVVMTDISDFYPRLYSHRLENALRPVAGSDDHARIVVKLLSQWNQSVSYGIPVGPAVFRLLAEIAIADVDETLQSEGIEFCRYSDDYRLFVDNQRSAREALALLANVLFKNHGLTLQESKTEIVPGVDFVNRFSTSESDTLRQALENRYQELVSSIDLSSGDALGAEGAPVELDPAPEIDDQLSDLDESVREFLLASIEIRDYVEIRYDDLTEDQQALVDSMNIWETLRSQLDGSEVFDVALVRFLLDQIVRLRLQDPADTLRLGIQYLYPIFARLVKAVSIQAPDDEARRAELGSWLLGLFDDEIVGYLEYHRAWILSVFSGDASWNHKDILVSTYNTNFDMFTRPETVLALGRAGMDHWFRVRKSEIMSLPVWERRAFLAGAACLPKDEAKHWYRSILPQLDPLETAIARRSMKLV